MNSTENKTGLSFLEKVILLALDDKGWFGSSENSIKFGLAGAILFELFKQNRIGMMEGVIIVKDPAPVNDVLLDRVLGFIRTGKRNRGIRTWIQRMVYKKMMIRKGILKSLIHKEVIRKEEYSLLRILFQFKYPVIDRELKRKVQEEIFDCILRDEKPDGYNLMMIAVMDSCKMIRKNFRHYENYPRFRKQVRELLRFDNPMEDTRIVGNIYNAIRRAIVTSNVSIHA